MSKFYSYDKIKEAKKVFFTVLNETAIIRRGDGKCKADLNDILNRFREADERKESLPMFVADGYSTMPPASGYEVLAEHLIHLMEEISGLKEQVKLLTDLKVGSLHENMTDMKKDLHDIIS